MEEKTFIDLVRNKSTDYNADKIGALNAFKNQINILAERGHNYIDFDMVEGYNIIYRFLKPFDGPGSATKQKSIFKSGDRIVDLYKYGETLSHVMYSLRVEGFEITHYISISGINYTKISW